MSATVLYDENCSLCRNLAGFMAKRTLGKLEFESWQKFVIAQEKIASRYSLSSDPIALAIWDGITLLQGKEAWDTLLAIHPSLSELHWLTQKLGITSIVSAALQTSAQSLRFLCRQCPRQTTR